MRYSATIAILSDHQNDRIGIPGRKLSLNDQDTCGGKSFSPGYPCIASHRRCPDVNDNHAKLTKTFLVADIIVSYQGTTPDLENGLDELPI